MNEAVERRNECAVRMENRRRLRARANDANMRRLESEWNEAKERVKESRRELRASLRRWEKEWWNDVIEECRVAYE